MGLPLCNITYRPPHKPSHPTYHWRLFPRCSHTPDRPISLTTLSHQSRLRILLGTAGVSGICSFHAILCTGIPCPDYFLLVKFLSILQISTLLPLPLQGLPQSHCKVIPPSLLLTSSKHFYHGIMRNTLLFYLSHCNLESVS